jgi:RHS repeat-associated protein
MMNDKTANDKQEVLQAGLLLACRSGDATVSRSNIRTVMNATGGVVQANNYYPSGVTMAELPRRSDQGVQPYKFGGKELDRSYGLDFYDFEARSYNPVLMRFTGFDPLASKYPGISPYAYCANNPVKYVDPDGRDPKNWKHWVRFGVEMFQSSTAMLSVGMQATLDVDASLVKLGIDANAGSVDLLGVREGTLTPGKNTPQKNKGVEIDAGIISFEASNTETDTGKSTVSENKIAVGVSIFEFHHTEMTETNNSTNQSVITTENGVKATDMKAKVSFILGVEVGLNMQKAAEALARLLKTN